MGLLAHRAGSPLAGVDLLCLGFGDTLSEDGGVLICCILGLLSLAALKRDAVALVLQTLGGNQSLNLGGLGVRLLALALRLYFTSDDELANIIILGETEELPDLRGALGTQTLRVDHVGDAGDVLLALLDDGESQHGQIHRDDAATDGFALSLTSAAWAVARVAVGEEKTDTRGMHNTLLHGETLLVVSAGDLENVALELVANTVAWNFGTHSLVHEHAQLPFIFNVDELLAAIGRE